MNQRKHELQTNELAQSLEANYEKFKPYMRQTLFIGGAVVLAVFAFVFWRQTRARVTEGQWEDYLYSVQTLENRGLVDVAKTYAGAPAGQFAQIRVADYELFRGVSEIVRNRDEFTDRMGRAIEAYETLAADTTALPFLRVRALFGAAHGYEAVGSFDKARKGYQELVDTAPNDPVTVLARQGLKRLSNPSVVAIHQKFREWKPPTTAPGADELLPARPNLDFPSEAPAASAPNAADESKEAAPNANEAGADKTEAPTGNGEPQGEQGQGG